jgi:hypothetical protein
MLSLGRAELIGCFASTLHEKENLARAGFWRHALGDHRTFGPGKNNLRHTVIRRKAFW